MKKRYLTLFVLTNDASKTKQFKLQVNALKAVAAVSVALFIVFAFILVDYTRLKGNALELSRLQKETTAQKIELQGLFGKIKGVEAELAKLNVFDRKLRIIANIEKPKGEGRVDAVLGLGGDSSKDADEYFTTPKSKVGDLVKDMHSELNDIEGRAKEQEKSFAELHEQLMKQSSLLAATPSIWPVRGWLTSRFGQRTSPYTGLPQIHKGLDIANKVGTPVVASADGIVIKSAWENNLGKTVIIRHGYGVTTTYAHLSEIGVRVGQKVKRGQKIAAVGNTGRSTGPHLHYQVALNGVEVNPDKYILE
ncbi:M23 family metallopeptidase [bacterium]|nr:MAG: M23 family metallopeptidase [bacterium]